MEANNVTIYRSASADVLKAISIFAVVYIHGSNLIPVPSSYSKSFLPLFRFCVPIFIFLWAYFAEKSINRKHNHNQISYLTARFTKLFIPFVFWSLVYFFITANLYSITLLKVLTKYWLGNGWSGQYYFIILFQLIIIFPFVRYLGHQIIEYPITIIIFSIAFYISVAYSSLFTINIITKIGDHLFIYWLPYVVLGVIYAIRGVPSRLALPLYVGLIAPIVIFIEICLFHPYIEQYSPYLLPSVFISSILILNSATNEAKIINLLNLRLGSFINALAKNTLGIFCLNPLVIITLSYIFHPSYYHLHFWGCSIIIPLFSTMLIIIICIGITNILKWLKLSILVMN